MRPRLLPLAGALALAACAGPTPEEQVRGALAEAFSALATGDVDRLPTLLAECRDRAVEDGEEEARRRCADRFAALSADVAAQREIGRYRFEDPWGLGLVRALVLGRGGYWSVEEVRLSENGDRAVARLLVRTQYRRDETVGLPPGALIEYLVEPLGRVKKLERGTRGPGALRRQLVELELRAVLERAPGPGGRRYRLRSLEPVEGSARFEEVSWWPE